MHAGSKLVLGLILAAGLSCGSDWVGASQIDACERSSHGSIGCSFSVTRLLHLRVNEKDPDAVVVTNPSAEITTRVQLIRGDLASPPVVLGPGEVHVFNLDERSIGGESTALARNAAVRIISEHPVSAYLMAPLANRTSNDGSLLIPDSALGKTYVIPSYQAFDDPKHPVGNGDPSYFSVIGQHDGTVVRFRPPVGTTAGDGIAAVEAGEQGEFVINRNDVVRIAALPLHDISGTVVEADAPVWVAGGVGCANVPTTGGYCDHLQEVLRPVEHWDTSYPAVAAPARAHEPHLWRIFAGAPGLTVTTDPPIDGVSGQLEQIGDWIEVLVPNGTVMTVTANGPILPVQYLVGQHLASGRGDPSMIQAIPRSAWLSRYVVTTGRRYSVDYVQIVRPAGGADVFVDGVLVDGYRVAQELEIADWVVEEGDHVVFSDAPFGLSSYGYSNDVDGTKRASYAMPGGFAG